MLTPRQKEIERQLMWNHTLFNVMKPVPEDNRLFYTYPTSRRAKRLLREFFAIKRQQERSVHHAEAKL